MGRGRVSPAHFLDEMTFVEVSDYLEGMEQDIHSEWERTRMLMYVIAQVNSSDRIEPRDILVFPWEEPEDSPVEDTEDSIEELKKRAEFLKKTKNE